MDIKIFYEIAALILVIARLITLRRKNGMAFSWVNFLYWTGILCSCVVIVRLVDGRISANTTHLAIIILIACVIWFKEFVKD